MKKVFKLVKSRKSSSASSTKGSSNRSPGRGSLGQASSSIGGESASATSMIYESQRNKRTDEVSIHSRQDNVASPSRSSHHNPTSNIQTQVSTLMLVFLSIFHILQML